MSPTALKTVVDPLRGYPAYWELMKWYLCWRKYPYPSEVIAALVVETRSEGYSHYPCPVDSDHWHIGRGDNSKSNRNKIPQAKRTYRKAVRDEIWQRYEENALVVQREEAERG